MLGEQLDSLLAVVVVDELEEQVDGLCGTHMGSV